MTARFVKESISLRQARSYRFVEANDAVRYRADVRVITDPAVVTYQRLRLAEEHAKYCVGDDEYIEAFVRGGGLAPGVAPENVQPEHWAEVLEFRDRCRALIEEALPSEKRTVLIEAPVLAR